jgi:hypothetical protein
MARRFLMRLTRAAGSSRRLNGATPPCRRLPMSEEKVFQDEPTLSALQRATAAKARKLAINCNGVDLDAHKLIQRVAIWAIELRFLG